MSRYSKKQESLRLQNIFIVVEGAHTEKVYYEYFASRQSVIKVIAPRYEEDDNGRVIDHTGLVKPQHLLQRAIRRFEKQTTINSKVDQVWFLMDADKFNEHHKVQDYLNDIAAAALKVDKENRHLVLTNPCFELWHYLHLKDLPEGASFKNCGEVTPLLRALGGFDPTRHITTATIQAAITRAKAIDKPNELVPPNPGTRVYQLAEVLIQLLQKNSI